LDKPFFFLPLISTCIFITYFPIYLNHKDRFLDFSKVIKGRKSNKLLFDEEIVNEYSLKKMKMLGFMSDNNNKYFGFIGLPNKKICKISFGDYLGIEQGEVVGIYPDKIIIKNNLSKEIISLSNKFKKLTYDKNFS
jgi:Tfp pilus assembly protein PilP